MIYSRDQWAQLPTRDLYNTNVMMAAVSAAKDMYDKRQKTMEDFYEKYGTFDSPFAKDMERYGNLIQNVTDAVDDMYTQGVDPLRSAEGGAQLSRLIHAFPIAELNRMKANAKIGYSYLDALGKLVNAGKFDQVQEDYYLRKQGLPSFADFSTAENGSWLRSSPVEAQSMFDMMYPMVKDIQPSLLTKEQVESLGYKYNPSLDYTGISEDMLRRSITNGIPGVKNTPGYDFFKDQARQELISQGITNPTEEQINQRFEENALTAVKQKMQGLVKQEINPLVDLNLKRQAARSSSGRDSQKPPKKAFTFLGDIVSSTYSKAFGITVSQFNDAANDGALLGLDPFNQVIKNQGQKTRNYAGVGPRDGLTKTKQFTANKKYLQHNWSKVATRGIDTWLNDGNTIGPTDHGSYFTYDDIAKKLKVNPINSSTQYKELLPSIKTKNTIDLLTRKKASRTSTGNIQSVVLADGRMHTFAEQSFTYDDENGNRKKYILLKDMGITSEQGSLYPDQDYAAAMDENDQYVNKTFGTTNQLINDSESYTASE